MLYHNSLKGVSVSPDLQSKPQNLLQSFVLSLYVGLFIVLFVIRQTYW